MHIIVVGAGQVGQAVACDLADKHELHVVDNDPDNLDKIPYDIDVTLGDGTELEVLREAGIDKANILITTTNLDQTNLVICNSAKLEGDPFTIARVTNTDYLKTCRQSPGAFGVDLMLGRAYLAAETITRLVAYSSRRQPAREVEFFANGKIQMAVYEVPEDSSVAGQTVAEADRFQHLTFGAIFRDEEMIFPSGADKIEAGDRIAVIGVPDKIDRFGREIYPPELDTDISDLVVFGGGSFGYQIVRQLHKYSIDTTVVERDKHRARYLAENLPEALVLHGSATDEELWQRENLERADMAVGAINPDADNLLVSLLAKNKGIPRVISIVQEKKYVDLTESTAVDYVINPRDEVSEEIIRYIEVDYAENITSIEHHRGTVFEVAVGPDSELVDRPLAESVQSLAEQLTVGAIVREDRVLAPRGQTQLREGDRLVVLTDAEQAEDVAERIK